MRVDVVKLRHAGKKLECEVVRGAVPIRGELTITRWRSSPVVPWEITARLQGTEGRVVDDLRDVRVMTLRGDAFVLVGVETYAPPQPHCSEQVPQAWWCRLVEGRLAPAQPVAEERADRAECPLLG